MIKRCTSCKHGVYDYGRERLYCKCKLKENNSACDDWELETFDNCSISHNMWKHCKKYTDWWIARHER